MIIGRSDSGWMVSSTFFEYISNGFFNWLVNNKIKLPVILFLDGHKSHLSMELANFCAENQIIIYCLPPNSTHIIQPCDVAIFKPLKLYWKNVVCKNKRSGNAITKTNFVYHFKEAFNSVQTSSIKNGFKKCGLFPFNADSVDYSKCISFRRNELFPIKNKDQDLHQIKSEEYKVALNVLENYIGKTKSQLFKEKVQNPFIDTEESSLFDFWVNLRQKVDFDSFDIEKMPIEFSCEVNNTLNTYDDIDDFMNYENEMPLDIINLGNYNYL